jgi:Tetratricopeptide repeat
VVLVACARPLPPPPSPHPPTEIEQARECLLAAEEAGDKKARDAFAQCGIRHARAAGDDYYLSWSLLLLASTKTITYALYPQARDAAIAAYKRNRRLDHAGPARLLGRIYSEVPPWPASIGDSNLAIYYAEQAVREAPEHPENHLRLANAYKNEGRNADARREYRIVLGAELVGEYARQLPRWQDEARQKLR